MTSQDIYPAYTLAKIRKEPALLLDYIHPPSSHHDHQIATTDADVRLVSLLHHATPETTEVLDAAVRAEHEDTMTQLQEAESLLREHVATMFQARGQTWDDDEDLSTALEQICAWASLPSVSSVDKHPSTAHTQHTEELAELYMARACTQLLSEMEEAQHMATQAPDDPQKQLTALRRLARLADEAPQRGPDGSPFLARALASIVQARDDLFRGLISKYKLALRHALGSIHWPPPEYENPNQEHRDHAPFHLFGSASLSMAWADLCELQFVAASLQLCSPPTCIRAPASVSSVESIQAIPAKPGTDEYTPLWAVNVLMEPLLLRFRYHFDGARPTNRLDKPEWFLSHMISLLKVNSVLFEPALDPWSHGGDVAQLTRVRHDVSIESPLRERHIAVDAPSELLHAILHPLRLKIQASMPRLANDHALLAHNISQFITFDSELRDTYAPSITASQGQGAVYLADEVLENDAWFQAWLDGERTFTEERFNTLLQAPGAWALVQADTLDTEEEATTEESDVNAVVDTDTTTRCAATLMHMLTSITERYQPLHSLIRRCAFIIQVQRPLLRQFLDRLIRHLDAFETMSTAFSRALPGDIASLSSNANTDAVRGVNGVTRVAKALLSASYVKRQLEEWAESSLFLNMAHEVVSLDHSSPIYRLMFPKHGKEDMDSANLISLLQRGLQRGAEAAATFRPLSKSFKDETQDGYSLASDDVSGIWDEYLSKFDSVVTRSTHALERLTVSEVLELLKPYILRRWDKDEDQETSENEPFENSIPSKELVPALAKLTTLLHHIVQILPPMLLLPVYRHIATSLSNAVVERILMPNARISQQFTPMQAKRFRLDVEQGWLHVAKELLTHPKVAARLSSNIPTGLGRNPENAWRLLIDAAQQL
ncbi:rint-1 family protein [Malassezia pachydermatis]|uniref:Rint-1 family protein n=1 Tax=Malassezia pachydermatis TaxID=77020 RepID=A0A0M8MVM6_9BASI|nr:rint-1 family protein [Malassezia pachydermatis]KOS14481.1 rint-1 family protein [Malassezia pachydermatis]